MPKKQKVIFVQTEGWFFLSHFRPLVEAISAEGNYHSSIITTVGDATPALEKLGLKVLPINFDRASFNFFSAIKLLFTLFSILRKERPDIVHFIALKPILIGGLASLFLPKTSKVYHLTGLGYLVDKKSWFAKLRRDIAFRSLAFFTMRPNSWLITENADDLAFVQSYGATKNRFTTFNGAGVDPEHFTPPPAIKTDFVRIAYVGRMIQSKGVDVLIAAMARLKQRGINIHLDLFGAPDTANPNSISLQTLELWNQIPNVTWHGFISDVRQVWSACEISVMPTLTREGMPRAMLEAAACARALVVTDVPGCRHFVQDQKTGLIVASNDADELASAIETLALDPDLRKRLGKSAREKIVDNYTEVHIKNALLDVYRKLNLPN